MLTSSSAHALASLTFVTPQILICTGVIISDLQLNLLQIADLRPRRLSCEEPFRDRTRASMLRLSEKREIRLYEGEAASPHFAIHFRRSGFCLAEPRRSNAR